jgi:hypothetical protein
MKSQPVRSQSPDRLAVSPPRTHRVLNSASPSLPNASFERRPGVRPLVVGALFGALGGRLKVWSSVAQAGAIVQNSKPKARSMISFPNEAL